MPTLDVSDTMNALLACVVEGLAEADRPVCRSGLTIGPPQLIGPVNCCDCTDGNGQVTAHLERVYPADPSTLEDAPRVDCRPGAFAATMVVVLARCYPTLDEQANIPTLEQTTPKALDLNDDASTVWEALNCCDTTGRVMVTEAAVDSDPEGGCSAVGVRLNVLVRL